MCSNELYHHGVKGQKWGIRRYQNEDGSLTEEGKKQYGYGKYISKNTKSRIIGGIKTGAKIGAVPAAYGAISTAVGFATDDMFRQNKKQYIAIGGAMVAGSLAAGTLLGAKIGTLSGLIETHSGRNYMRKHGIQIEEVA